MSSRPNIASSIVEREVESSLLALEVCFDTQCLLLFEDASGYLLFEQPIEDLTILVPTTRQNPANVLIMPPSRPNPNTTTVPVQTRNQRSVTSSPIVVAANDEVLSVNIATGTPICTLPTASSRGGAALTFKDVGGHFFANNLTLTGQSGELIDGQASYVLANDYAAITVNPFDDGVNSGWFVT